MSSIIRRRVLVGAAALVAGAIPSAAQPADPVFAAIGAHRRAHVALNVAFEAAEPELDTPAIRAAEVAEAGALMGLIETRPTTLDGHLALLRYITRRGDEREAICDLIAETLDAVA
jgi:hypothetical protein